MCSKDAAVSRHGSFCGQYPVIPSVLRELSGELDRLRARGGRGAVATLVETTGSSANRAGDRLLLTDEERLVGDVNLGGCASPRLLHELREVRETGEPHLLTLDLGEETYEFGLSCTAQLTLFIQPFGPDLEAVGAEHAYLALERKLHGGQQAVLITFRNGLQFAFDRDEANPSLSAAVRDAAHTLGHAGPGVGSVCLYEGGQPAVLLERFVPPPHLVIVGAGAISAKLAALAEMLDFRVTVTDSEPLRLTERRFPHAERRRVDSVDAAVDVHSLGPNDYLILTSHNYADEVAALRGAVFSKARYIGMVASRRRGRAVLRYLEELGLPRAQLARVHTPAGLDVGAVTPTEIALSIFSEVLAARTGHSGGRLLHPTGHRAEIGAVI